MDFIKENGRSSGKFWYEFGVREGGEKGKSVGCELFMGYRNTCGMGFEFTLEEKSQRTQYMGEVMF